MGRSKRQPEGRPELGGSAPADFEGYVARNLSDAYRLAVMVLDDPIAAARLAHDALVSAWSTTGTGDQAVDAAFDRVFAAGLTAAVEPAPAQPDAPTDPVELAVAELSPGLQVELARSLGPWRKVEEAADGAAANGGVPHGASVGGAAGEALRALDARRDASGDAAPPELETRLRAMYTARDPGEPPPLHLRLRLQQAARDAEAARAAAAEQADEAARRTRRSGWGFVLNALMALIVLVLVVALASMLNVRASTVVSNDPTSDPVSPLTISGVSVVQGAIDGSPVHVGATQRTMIASFPPSPAWHLSSRDCQADVVGIIDWQGQTTWISSRAGHADEIAGDPSSTDAYVTGPGEYCQVGRFSSADGGLTWALGPLPGNNTASPSWLAFDPAFAHTLLAYYSGTLYVSPDSGATWKSRQSAVIPLAFDPAGRLVGWTPGKLFESLDDGASWNQTGVGPLDRPVAAGATADGVLVGSATGLWWYPLTAAPSLVESGSVFAIATLAQGAVVVGADAAGHPWLGTVDSTMPGISMAGLPPEVAKLQITGGEVAVNDIGAVVALSGPSSVIALAGFAH
jgi:hypothetical protein